MRKFLIVPMIACVVGVVFLTATYNEECRRDARHPEWIKDVEVEISDIENGVLIKITSDNLDAVELIQEYAARYVEKFRDDACIYDCDNEAEEQCPCCP